MSRPASTYGSPTLNVIGCVAPRGAFPRLHLSLSSCKNDANSTTAARPAEPIA